MRRGLGALLLLTACASPSVHTKPFTPPPWSLKPGSPVCPVIDLNKVVSLLPPSKVSGELQGHVAQDRSGKAEYCSLTLHGVGQLSLAYFPVGSLDFNEMTSVYINGPTTATHSSPPELQRGVLYNQGAWSWAAYHNGIVSVRDDQQDEEQHPELPLKLLVLMARATYLIS